MRERSERFLIGVASIALASCTYATMMYWFPLLDFTGNLPVWSVATFPVGSLGSMDFRETMFVRALPVLFGVAVISVCSLVSSFVLRMCCRVSFMWPFAVASDGGRCFCTNCAVSPGKVAKNPLVMALHHVCGTGLQQAR